MLQRVGFLCIALAFLCCACSGERNEGFLSDSDAAASVGEGSATVGARCGDKIKGAREECDAHDLGDQSCDGLGLGSGELSCLSTCRFDTSSCATPMICGDGTRAGTESCDDGNTDDNDGCSHECALESERCGDGCVQRARGELCEAGQRVVDTCAEIADRPQGIERCSATCGYDSPECPSLSTCGNGLLDLGESCDDGNTQDNDGCSNVCRVERSCGDGIRQELEACDGADLGGASCSSFGFALGTLRCANDCYLDLSGCRAPICGDGFLDDGEECDDGNADGGDGCGCACVIELCADGAAPNPMWPDEDGDGQGDRTKPPVYLCTPRARFAPRAGDCNDRLDYVHEGASERCNGADDDCNGVMDDAIVYRNWFIDHDADGHGDMNGTAVKACDAPENHIDNNDDCDDRKPTIHPGASELCDGVDNDCNASTPDGAEDPGLNQACDGTDSDLCTDGKRICTRATLACNDDANGIRETCNGADDNCNGSIDEGVTIQFYRDRDGDQFGADKETAQLCAANGEYRATVGGDCNDSVRTINPKADEQCNGVDDNCNGIGDEPRQCIGLTVAKTGNGTGRIWSNDQRIDCGSTCSAGYDYGASVVLMAQGDAYNVFSGWANCPEEQGGNCIVPNTSALTVTAQFNTSSLNVTLAHRGGTALTTRGNVVHSLNGSTGARDNRIDCVQRLCFGQRCFDTGCSANYTPGTNVLLSADPMIPNTNCYFDGWVSCSNPDNQARTCWQWVTGDSVTVEARYYCEVIR